MGRTVGGRCGRALEIFEIHCPFLLLKPNRKHDATLTHTCANDNAGIVSATSLVMETTTANSLSCEADSRCRVSRKGSQQS